MLKRKQRDLRRDIRRLKLVTGVETSTRSVSRSGSEGKATKRNRRRAAAMPNSRAFCLSRGIGGLGGGAGVISWRLTVTMTRAPRGVFGADARAAGKVQGCKGGGRKSCGAEASSRASRNTAGHFLSFAPSAQVSSQPLDLVSLALLSVAMPSQSPPAYSFCGLSTWPMCVCNWRRSRSISSSTSSTSFASFSTSWISLSYAAFSFSLNHLFAWVSSFSLLHPPAP